VSRVQRRPADDGSAAVRQPTKLCREAGAIQEPRGENVRPVSGQALNLPAPGRHPGNRLLKAELKRHPHSTIDQTDDRDPFAFGGRNGETATVDIANRASGQSSSAVGMASESDADISSMFRRWVESERDLAEKCEQASSDDESERLFEESGDFGLMDMARRPAEGAVGLAIKMFLALYGRYGNGKTVPSVDGDAWIGENAGFLCSDVERALADDLVRFVPR
jgi:hypothetical protein